ncbi:DUF3389 family protein [Shewanella litorisediminis]|uniref:DUF3389 family protein n=1 Tax=Shewanella litorisediminis TaxID=1173586 RepID=A0ABX7FZ41_9GAMM|nr:DUF3389 family protein [Shewanella litorisediminis]MCL2918719.1 DUF3389 domain-containing protein [Shewanella litorisediminis]QRH00308.1 DUF3389 family protein [Shewanella litorisediminis]
MIISHSQGKLILAHTELLCRLNGGVQLRALVDDMRLLAEAKLLIADAGAVSWSLLLDDDGQLEAIAAFYGLEKDKR